MEERLQRILAQMGVASRRKAEELILEGRVTVNGETARLGMKADPSRDRIKVNGRLLTNREPRVYLAFYKPRGVVTSLSDPEGRRTVKDFLKGIRYRVFPVGRLDYDSEGLLLLSNDGDFANALLHPSRKVPKTYHVKVKGKISQDSVERLRTGVRLEDGLTMPAELRLLRFSEVNSWLEITIREGRRRQIRRMLEKVGHPVLRLRRIAIDGLTLRGLKPGQLRYLTEDDLRLLMAASARSISRRRMSV
ncbi:MAG TPA: pseudouridine synthase [Dissulfurispiraceae bacterium]|jgi:23S rRNA pseudouridine2605 synthase|nr:pseudouridine synthase [Dissulfurispiraceae bacterium]